jgi:uncharacterized membrane protein
MRTFLVFEIFVLSLFLVACWQVLQRDAAHRLEFVLALLYALLFEELDMRFFKTYQYGEGYTLVLGHVPLAIPLAWAIILSTSMQMSDCCTLSDSARACFDALLAVLLDLSVDAIAIRRGYWQWDIPLQAGWFGVPAGNLYAWMFVVFFFSLLCRCVRRLSATHRTWLILELLVPPVAYLGLVLSLLAVGTVNAILQLDEQTRLGSVLAVGVLFLGGLLHHRWRSGLQVQAPLSPLIAGIRLGLHGFFLLELLTSGLFLTTPLLVVVALSVLLIELGIHRALRPRPCVRGPEAMDS